MEREVIITAPSLDPSKNVSGVSAVAKFIIDNNRKCHYRHFEMGKKDDEKGGVVRLLTLVKAFFDWRRELRNRPTAIVHYNFPLSPRAIFRDSLFIGEAIRRNQTVLVHIHGGLYLTAKRIPVVQGKILKWVFAQDVPFVVLSEMEKEMVTKRFGAKRVTVLPNCVELPVNVNVNVNGNGEPLIIGYLGRIEANKGMAELLAACKRLRDEGVNFRMVMAGMEQGTEAFVNQFEKALGARFKYVGVVSGKAKSDFFNEIDVFAMPTYFEGLPIALLECMSYGVVPVVTPVGSIPQVVTDGKDGILVGVKEVEPLVDAIRRLAADREQTLNMGREAKETIFSHFSPKHYVEQLNQVYESLTC